ncbi:MAG: Crp/Fnr family transcriptional regulator [Amylibacter sp.]|nr:Crp/Fnr family transcriptional regulator [Amylibacter sp.]
MTPEYEKIARGSLLMTGMLDHVSKALLASAHRREFDRGATIFLQGEQSTAIYIVASGWVKLYRTTTNGHEAVVGVFTKGNSFGEAVALRSDTYPVCAEAATNCSLIRIEAVTLLNIIHESPEAAIAILSATFAHLHSLVAQVEQLKAQTGAQRVAEFLLDLVTCDENSCIVKLPFEKVLIAARLGLKPESLSRSFSKLRKQGVSVKKNTALIGDINKLRSYVMEDPADSWK